MPEIRASLVVQRHGLAIDDAGTYAQFSCCGGVRRATMRPTGSPVSLSMNPRLTPVSSFAVESIEGDPFG
jgi:hypothetical protein